MTDKTARRFLGFLFPLSLCLAAANCGGDPAIGTWTNTTAPTGVVYDTYKATLTFSEPKTLMVEVQTSRGGGAITYAGCMESITGTGTYTDEGTTLTSTFDSGMSSRTGCVYMQDNLASMPLDAMTKAGLVAISSGTFTIVETAMTLKASSGMLKYTKAAP